MSSPVSSVPWTPCLSGVFGTLDLSIRTGIFILTDCAVILIRLRFVMAYFVC